MRVYLAGPMRNLPQFNFPAFFQAEKELRYKGHEVFNPARRDIEKYGKGVADSPTGDLKDTAKTGFNLRDALASDLAWICLNADAVALLPGWTKSKGAQAEHAVAVALDLELIYL